MKFNHLKSKKHSSCYYEFIQRQFCPYKYSRQSASHPKFYYPKRTEFFNNIRYQPLLHLCMHTRAHTHTHTYMHAYTYTIIHWKPRAPHINGNCWLFFMAISGLPKGHQEGQGHVLVQKCNTETTLTTEDKYDLKYAFKIVMASVDIFTDCAKDNKSCWRRHGYHT